MEVNNIWFYTFSTSAQVMASLVGLFAVFVVYKIQEFSDLLSETREATIKLVTYLGANTKDYEPVLLHSTVSMSDTVLLKKFRELVEIKETEPDRLNGVDQTIFLGTIAYTLNEASLNFFGGLVYKKQQITGQLKKTLVLSFTVIAISISALIATSLIIGYVSLLIFGILFLYTLFDIARGIYLVATT